ncbi:MAG TPA: RNA pseudouridine synthase, partial [Thermoanaerobaculia bacterium]|nr:RNA pseudouridine synthase [Thermoanaerobaculia bacterium]
AREITTPIDGKPALTIVRPLRKVEHGTLVEIDLRTGRTHQIRIHLASIAHPVAGDRRYGSTINLPRLMLHAWRIEHAEIGAIEAPIPPEFV